MPVALPKVSLGAFPTPLVCLERLSGRLGGPRIYMKRDDLTGLACGGNKTRKLEYLVGDALQQGADTLVTAGAGQSNHCRQTAAAAARFGMECHLLLGGSRPSFVNGNLLLDHLLGARIHWAGDHRKGEDLPELVEQLRQAGRKPYVIPYGGSNLLGAMGFVDAWQELEAQIRDTACNPSHVVFASSSGGTHAGLMAGAARWRRSCDLIGIRIDKEPAGDGDLSDHVLSLASRAAAHLGLGAGFTKGDVVLHPDFTGGGYGVVGEVERGAIRLVAQTEGIMLDPVYTGRAMGGLIAMIRDKRFDGRDQVLFWHTGGTPALFDYAASLAT